MREGLRTPLIFSRSVRFILEGSLGMAKVYQKGVYVEVDPYEFPSPHEDLAYIVNGRRYKFVLCHWEYGGVLRGYNTHTKAWWDLYPEYVQREDCMPVEAELVDGEY